MNNNSVNELNVNHTHFISERDLSSYWYDSIEANKEQRQELYNQQAIKNKEFEANLFRKQCAYKDGELIYLTVKEGLEVTRFFIDIEIKVYTSTLEEIACKLELEAITPDGKIICRLIEGKLDLRHIWFVGLLTKVDE